MSGLDRFAPFQECPAGVNLGMGHDGQESMLERNFCTAAAAGAESFPSPWSEPEVQRVLHPSAEYVAVSSIQGRVPAIQLNGQFALPT